ESSVGRVEATGIVKFKRGSSDSCVLCACGVKQKRCSASGRIEIPEVKIKRSSANRGVEVASGDAKQRKRADSCVPKTQRESLKGVVPRSSCEVGIAPGGRWYDCLRLGRKTAKRTDDETYRSYFSELKHECVHMVLRLIPPLVVSVDCGSGR